MKLLIKKSLSKRFIFRRRQKTFWIKRQYWVSRMLSLFITNGRKNLVLKNLYISLMAMKLLRGRFDLLSPLYLCLQNALPLIGFVRVKWTRGTQVNPKLRPRIEKPLRCYNLAFRWIRTLLKSVDTVYFFERFHTLTDCLKGRKFNAVLLQKFKHYKTAVLNMQYLRVRFFRVKKHRKVKKFPLAKSY